MQYDLFQIDAFTDKIFSGNPACVVPLKEWLPDEILINIAKENAVAETAFFVEQNSSFHLRWFTPEMEMDLCGHATLAAAHAINEILQWKGDKIIFKTQSGQLEVAIENSKYTLNFPSRMPKPIEMPDLLSRSLNLQPQEILQARDIVLLYPDEEDIRNIKINRLHFDQLELGTGGVIVTSAGKDCDFVSRFFTPGASVFEDPVTGSAHCSLIPFWSEKLGKETLSARQLSGRGGTLYCQNKQDRVLISGHAKTYFVGKFRID